MIEGSFAWYELATTDPAAAETFYAAVAGWSMVDSGMPGVRYTLAQVGDRPVAGLMGFPPDMGRQEPKWFGYVSVGDVDSMAGRVREAGGRIHREPSDIPGVGRFAVASDPQGAAFMLFRGAGEAPAELPANTPGTMGWRELRTSDWEAAFGFYSGLFGWQRSYAHDMGPMGVYQTFSIGGAWAGGMMTGDGAPAWTYYIAVDDIDAAAARVTAAGGAVVSGPHEVPGGSHVVAGADPQGARFALVGPRGAAVTS